MEVLSLIAAAGAALAVPAATAAPQAAPGFCRGDALTVVFRVIPGSAGAGSISYNLQLRNRSTASCVISGLPRLRLVGRYGRALPTHVSPARPTQQAIRPVIVPPGGYAAATARFSPDVPGPGEPVAAPCERTAYRVVLSAPAGGIAVGPVLPPTPVCQHGLLRFSPFVAGKLGPQTA